MLVNCRFGNVLVAIREDPLRTELLGYDVRSISLRPSSSAARSPG